MNYDKNKINLDFERTLTYFLDHIDWGNSLSDTILKKIDFSKGSFFTFLPNDANFDKLYDFKHGGILRTTKPIIKLPNHGGYLEEVPNTRSLVTNFVYDFLQQDPANFCIGEDVIRSPTDKSFKRLDIDYVLLRDEIYYLLDKKNTFNEVEDVVCLANALYHMLVVLAKGSHFIEKDLMQYHLELISQSAIYIIGSAYDGESYIVWEQGNCMKK
jgi:hypothetical protein